MCLLLLIAMMRSGSSLVFMLFMLLTITRGGRKFQSFCEVSCATSGPPGECRGGHDAERQAAEHNLGIACGQSTATLRHYRKQQKRQSNTQKPVYTHSARVA